MIHLNLSLDSVMTECMVLCHSLTLSSLVSHKHNGFYSQTLRRPCCLYSMVINLYPAAGDQHSWLKPVIFSLSLSLYIQCCCTSCTLAVERYILDWIHNASSHTDYDCVHLQSSITRLANVESLKSEGHSHLLCLLQLLLLTANNIQWSRYISVNSLHTLDNICMT